MSDALLLAAVFEGLKRSRSQWAIVVPEAFRPIPLNRAILPKPNANESREEFLRRRRIFAALASTPADKAPDGLLSQLVEPSGWHEFHEKRGDAPCKYCLANDIATGASAHDRDWSQREVLQHANFTIDFNPDTFVTKVSIADFVVRMPGTWAAELAANAHPLRWSTAVPDFFLKSSPAKRDEVGWYETTGWDSNEGGYLYEVTHWDWNESMSAEVHNILEITNVSTAGGISYDYSLRECLRSNMGVTWEQGGLDVDEGFYRLRISEPSAYRPGTKTALKPEQIAWNQGDVVVTISSEKSVRYTPPNVSPAEIGAILNLMAPATVSMLMRRLVLDSVDPPASAPIASAPIASAPTAAA